MATIPAVNKRSSQLDVVSSGQSYGEMPLDLYGSMLGSNTISDQSLDNSILGLLVADSGGSNSLNSFDAADPSKVIDVVGPGSSTTSPDVSGASNTSTSPDVRGASTSPDFPDVPVTPAPTTPDSGGDPAGYSAGYRDPSKRPDLFGGGAPATTPPAGSTTTSPDLTGSTTPAKSTVDPVASSTNSGKSSTSSESASGMGMSAASSSVSPDTAGSATLLSSVDEPVTGSGMLGTARGGGIYPSANRSVSASSGSSSAAPAVSSSTNDGGNAANVELQSMFDNMQAPASAALTADAAAMPTSAWDGLGGSANSGHAMFDPMPQNNVVDWSADTNVISAQLFPGY